MGPGAHERALRWSGRAYRALLRAYPRGFRDAYGGELARCFRDLCREALTGGGSGLAALWVRTLPELLYTALKERLTMSNKNAYRSAVGVTLAATLILVWASLGLGIIGADGDPANLMYFGVPAVGVIGALIARFRPRGMARTLVAMALTQAFVAGIALAFGLGLPWSPPVELLALNGFFALLFVGAAWLFRSAARGRTHVQ